MKFLNRGDKNQNQTGNSADAANGGGQTASNQPPNESEQRPASQDASSTSNTAGNGTFSSTATPSNSTPDLIHLHTEYEELREEPDGARVRKTGKADIQTDREHLSDDLAALQAGFQNAAANPMSLPSAPGNEPRLLSQPTRPDSSADHTAGSSTAAQPSAPNFPSPSKDE